PTEQHAPVRDDDRTDDDLRVAILDVPAVAADVPRTVVPRGNADLEAMTGLGLGGPGVLGRHPRQCAEARCGGQRRNSSPTVDSLAIEQPRTMKIAHATAVARSPLGRGDATLRTTFPREGTRSL